MDFKHCTRNNGEEEEGDDYYLRFSKFLNSPPEFPKPDRRNSVGQFPLKKFLHARTNFSPFLSPMSMHRGDFEEGFRRRAAGSS